MMNRRIQREVHAEMLKDMEVAGVDHPVSKAYLENRKQLRAAKDAKEYVRLTLEGAELWKAVHNRAKHVRAGRLAAETRRTKNDV